MKQIKMAKLNELIYYTKLDNGLDIYFYLKENCHNNYATFTTRFGSMNNEFIPYNKNKMIKVPNGIAHFLEHKVFAQEEGEEVAAFFEKTGTSYNAHTSLKNTVYEIYGPNNIYENVSFLLDYVQSPYFTDENIEVEKGIIKEEINMYADDPWSVLYDKIRLNSFNKDSVRNSISGSVKDIMNINKELLYDCYNTFYHPSNMFLVVTGNFDKDKLLKQIMDNQSKKQFNKIVPIKVKTNDEKKAVLKKEEIINMNTNIAKYAYNIKIPLNDFKDISKRQFVIYIYILFNILFDDTSDIVSILKEKEIITNNFIIDILNTDDYMLVSLINETNNYALLEKEIDKVLKNININIEDFTRKKKVFMSNEVFGYDDINVINDIIIDNIIFDNKVEENIINIIEGLSFTKLKEIIKKIDFNNKCTVVVKK